MVLKKGGTKTETSVLLEESLWKRMGMRRAVSMGEVRGGNSNIAVWSKEEREGRGTDCTSLT